MQNEGRRFSHICADVCGAGFTVSVCGCSTEWPVTFSFYSLRGLTLTLYKKLKFRIGS